MERGPVRQEQRSGGWKCELSGRKGNNNDELNREQREKASTSGAGEQQVLWCGEETGGLWPVQPQVERASRLGSALEENGQIPWKMESNISGRGRSVSTSCSSSSLNAAQQEEKETLAPKAPAWKHTEPSMGRQPIEEGEPNDWAPARANSSAATASPMFSEDASQLVGPQTGSPRWLESIMPANEVSRSNGRT